MTKDDLFNADKRTYDGGVKIASMRVKVRPMVVADELMEDHLFDELHERER